MTHLNGSEKQVAWATDIRKEFIEKTKANMKSAEKEDSGRKPSVRDILKAKIAEKDGGGASAPTDEEPRIVYDLSDWDFFSEPAEDRPCHVRFMADDKEDGRRAEIITNRHGEGRWVRDSTTGDYIQISGTSQYRLPRTKNALKCQLAFRLRG